jgi:hypothetical protein
MTEMSPRALRAVLVLVLLGWVFGCTKPGEEPPELEVVEVDAGATARMTPEGDATEPDRGPALAGSLPPAFPGDLPLPLPASVTELADEGAGRRYLVLRAADPVDAVRSTLPARLERAGWRSEGGDPWVRVKDVRRVRFRFEADPVTRGALVRIDY